MIYPFCRTYTASITCIEERQLSCTGGFQATLSQTLSFFNAVLDVPCSEPICRTEHAGKSGFWVW